jgi:hypothetical protein
LRARVLQGLRVFVAPRAATRTWRATFRILLSYKQVFFPVKKVPNQIGLIGIWRHKNLTPRLQIS